MTRIFVIAATPILRSGLRAMLSTTDIEVVGEAPALTLYDGAELRGVQVVVVDERLLEDTLVAIEGDRTLSVVVLSDDERIAAQLREVNLRSWGIVLPDAPPEELQAAVLAAAQGLIVIPGSLSERIFTQPTPVKALSIEPLDEPLTSRELEVLDWLGQGLSNKLIARQLQISEHTVKFHISSIYAKLGVSSRTEAVRRGSHLGLITH